MRVHHRGAGAKHKKGEYRVSCEASDFSLLDGCEILFVPSHATGADAMPRSPRCGQHGQARRFSARTWLAVELLLGLDDDLWLATLRRASAATGVPLVAAGDVHMHVRSRKPLQDVITAVREGKAVAECGLALQASAERHLRPRVRLGGIYPPELLANTLVVAARCNFSLEIHQVPIPDGNRAAGHDARRRRCGSHHAKARPGAIRRAFPGRCAGSWCTSCG